MQQPDLPLLGLADRGVYNRAVRSTDPGAHAGCSLLAKKNSGAGLKKDLTRRANHQYIVIIAKMPCPHREIGCGFFSFGCALPSATSAGALR